MAVTASVAPLMEAVTAAGAHEIVRGLLKAVVAMVNGALSTYVPAPPVPVPSAVMAMPGAAVRAMPIAIAPVVTPVAVSVGVPITPVTAAAAHVAPVIAADCETLTVYVPTPPVVSAPSAVMVVPVDAPVSVCPTASKPLATAVTVSIVPEMEPDTEAPVQAGVMGVLAALCITPNVYVPVPPVPVPSALMTVFAVAPESVWPTAKKPPVGAVVTVSVEPEM